MTGFKEFFVYKYTFEDGNVYIGRSSYQENRFNDPSKYENQEVGKHMRNPYKAEIIFETANPYMVCYAEMLYIELNYDNSHNGMHETGTKWFIEGAKLAAKKFGTDINSHLEALEELAEAQYNVNHIIK